MPVTINDLIAAATLTGGAVNDKLYAYFGSNFLGSGSPEGVVTAPVGSTYRRTDGAGGTSFYVKESGTGNTGWVAYGGTGSFQPLDADLTAIAAISPSQGDVIYHNGTAWVRLAAGTSGQFLKTLGAGANPAWASVSGTGVAWVIGAGAGNHTTTSSTFADIDAQYAVTIAAASGDKLLIRFVVPWFHSSASDQCRIRFAVAGTAIATMATNGWLVTPSATDSRVNNFEWAYTVQAGDVSGGNVIVKPQFATSGGTLTIRNDGTNGKPLMLVENLRQ